MTLIWNMRNEGGDLKQWHNWNIVGQENGSQKKEQTQYKMTEGGLGWIRYKIDNN